MIFQWESASATQYLRELLSDETVKKIQGQANVSYMDLLSIGNGAIRPAGASYREELAQGIFKDNGNEALNEFLAPTLGYLVYQEQIIDFLYKFCGFTMGEADVVRRCVDENTYITMSNGLCKKIKDIKPGDMVASYNQNAVVNSTVKNVFDNGNREVYEITLSHGYKLKATLDHKVLTQSGWKTIKELSPNDYIMTPTRLQNTNDGITPNKRLQCSDMFLIGMLIGDGCIFEKSGLHFTNSDYTLINKFKDCVNKRLRNKNECEFRVAVQDGKNVDKIYSISILTKSYRDSVYGLLENLGIAERAAQKMVPKKIMNYPIGEKLSSLLGGLFSTDGGYVTKSRSIEYYSISEELCYNIKNLLLKYNIYSYIYRSYNKKYGYFCYKLRINQKDSLIKFGQKILPFIVGGKYKTFANIINDNNEVLAYNYYAPNYFVEEIRNQSKAMDISLNESNAKLLSTITDVKAKKIIGQIYAPKTYKMIYADYQPLKVINIKSVGISHVYDLEIDKTHNYIANGLVVHNCFAKKYGTEDMIPIIKNGGYINEGRHYIKGFIQTMVEQYNVSKKEAEELIVDFIKVIEDASAYLFSKNHADPYSWVGYICGYLRYHYPLEFITTALNIFADKEEKTLAIVDYAKKQGIPIKPIKFRFSTAEYSFNKETNEIFKGISSIKFMNVAIADEIYQLRDNEYSAFSDLLYDLDEKTSLNSRQLKILIELDFFEEFGDTNKLLKMSEIYDRFKGKVQIRKDILDEYGIDKNIVRRNSEKETDKMFSKPHTKEMLRDIEADLRILHRSLTDRIAAQIEYLGYINIADARYSRMLAVLSVDTKYAPKIKVHSLKNGTILELKIDRKTYNRNKLKEGDIIRVTRQIKKNKTKRLEDGAYEVIPDTKEIWLTEYKKVDNL